MRRRREFIAGLGGAAVWTLAARAQQGERVRRIGVLTQRYENASAFTQALAGLGWADRRNVRTDLRWHDGDANRIPALARELVGLQPDIIVTAAQDFAHAEGCGGHRTRVTQAVRRCPVTNRGVGAIALLRRFEGKLSSIQAGQLTLSVRLKTSGISGISCDSKEVI